MADLQALLGDLYKENMTIDEINAAIADKTFVDPATLPKNVEKTLFDKVTSELSAKNKELAAIKEASLTEAEKAKIIQDEAATAKSDFKKALSKLRAQQIFTTAGLSETEYSEIIDNFVSEDEEGTKVKATALVTLLNAQKEASEKALKAKLLAGTPGTPNGTPPKVEPTEYSEDFAEFKKQREKEQNK